MTRAMRQIITLVSLFAVLTFLLGGQVAKAQTQPLNTQEQDSTRLETVVVQATRASNSTPVPFTTVTDEELAPRNLGQDLPILLNYLPNVVTTSDAGAGVGYTGLRVRGSDATRVNVTINGVPYNDAESNGVFWVNLPDFASNVESVQLQRGVGTSTNGAGAFGASLNIKTTDINEEASASISNSVGSFGTRRHTLGFSTGLIQDYWEIAGRVSQIKSDGYVDRASSDLKSYYLSAAYKDEKNLFKLLIFGGQERTYQAYYGVDPATLESDRTFNPAGLYQDDNGDVQFYDDQVDNYNQDHYQLAFSHKFSDKLTGNATLHFTDGRGFFEEYQESDFFFDITGQNQTQFDFYGITPVQDAQGNDVTAADLVTRRWLDNSFYGIVTSLNYVDSTWNATFGAALNQYDGDHYGEIIYARTGLLDAPGQRFYQGTGLKTDVNAFAKAETNITQKLRGYLDLQIRNVDYETGGTIFGGSDFNVDENYTFFNPKAGLTYRNGRHQVYASVGVAHREPNRTDFENGTPDPERLVDYELGYRYGKPKLQFNANAYYMDYSDQLVLSGAIDDQGFPIRVNSGSSYRLGLELEAAWRFADQWSLRTNLALSQNENRDFIVDDGTGPAAPANTEISFSPSVVAGNALTWMPQENFQISLLSKFVGEQQLDNTDSETDILESYFVNDLNVSYGWTPSKIFKKVTASLLVNNILDEEYEANGYTFPGFGAFYFPQAGTNLLVGLTLDF